MRAYVAQSSLLSMMLKAAKVVSKDTLDTVMGSALLVAEDGGLSVTSSDGTRWVRCVSPANVEEQGAIAVSARRLLKFAKGVQDGAIGIESGDGVANVTCGRSKANLLMVGTEAMASFPQPVADASVTVQADTLLDMSKAASRMASKDNSRPVQQGIHVVASDGTLRMEACGSFMAATCEAACGEGALDVVVPANSFTDALSAGDGEVVVGTGNGSLSIATARSAYVTRTIEGTFPNVGMLFGAGHSSSVVVDSSELLAAMDLLSAIDAVSVHLASKDGELVVSAYSNGDGLVETVVEANVTGDVDINLNPRNIRDAAVMGGDMELRFKGGMQPVVALSEGYGWKCVMTPMR